VCVCVRLGSDGSLTVGLLWLLGLRDSGNSEQDKLLGVVGS
jgi:hypothetical protein